MRLQEEKNGKKDAAKTVSRQEKQKKRKVEEKREKKDAKAVRYPFAPLSHRAQKEKPQKPLAVTAAEGEKIPNGKEQMYRRTEKTEISKKAERKDGKQNVKKRSRQCDERLLARKERSVCAKSRTHAPKAKGGCADAQKKKSAKMPPFVKDQGAEEQKPNGGRLGKK